MRLSQGANDWMTVIGLLIAVGTAAVGILTWLNGRKRRREELTILIRDGVVTLDANAREAFVRIGALESVEDEITAGGVLRVANDAQQLQLLLLSRLPVFYANVLDIRHYAKELKNLGGPGVDSWA